MNVTLKNKNTEAIISSRGGELLSLKKDGKEILWDRNPKFWGDSALVLFPFIGRNYNDTYTLEGKEYNVGIHGFAFQSEFEVKTKTDHTVHLLLKENEETLKVYPYRFEFHIFFVLGEDKISVRFKVINTSDTTMYYNLGWHPGFMLHHPLNEYEIVFKGAKHPEEIGIVTKCMLDGTFREPELNNKRMRLSKDLFTHSARIYRGLGKTATLMHRDEKIVTLNFQGFENIVLWQTLNSDADFICMEGWRGLPGTYEKIEEISSIPDKSHLESNEYHNYRAEIKF